jgi:membrane protein
MSNVKHHPFARNRSAAKPAEPVGPGEPARAQRPPQSPTDLPRPAWTAVLKRALVQFKHDDITDRAAALTYFGVLALFPGVLVLVSILGLLGRSTTDKVLTNIDQLAPGGVRTFLRDVVHQTQGRTGAAGAAAIIGVIVALWSASGYIAAFMRASNTIYGVDEGRPIWKTAPVRLAVTIAVVIMLVISAVIVVFTGSVASQFGHALGVGDTGVLIWDIVKWPVLIVIVSLMLSLLYKATPNIRQPRFRWISAGGIVAVLIWLIASGLFAVYVSFSGSYNKTYGSLATVIVFLVWLWITNIAILLGAEFNAEAQRERAIRIGVPDDLEPYEELRDTRKLDEPEKRRVEEAERTREQIKNRER